MNRRRFLRTVSVGLLASLLAADAKQPTDILRIVELTPPPTLESNNGCSGSPFVNSARLRERTSYPRPTPS
jgi:hypothetical protein